QGGLALGVMCPQLRRADEDAEEVPRIGRAGHLDAERGADDGAAAAAVDQVTGPDLVVSVLFQIAHPGDHMVAGVANRVEPAAPAQLDPVEAPRALDQDRIEEELVAALRTLGTVADRPAAAMARPLDAGDLMPRERRDIENGVGKILRRSRGLDGI